MFVGPMSDLSHMARPGAQGGCIERCLLCLVGGGGKCTMDLVGCSRSACIWSTLPRGFAFVNSYVPSCLVCPALPWSCFSERAGSMPFRGEWLCASP